MTTSGASRWDFTPPTDGLKCDLPLDLELIDSGQIPVNDRAGWSAREPRERTRTAGEVL